MPHGYRTVTKSRRLHDFDYRSGHAYFITLCVQGRARWFGAVRGGAVQLSPIGALVAEEWQRVAVVRPGVLLDEFVVMPDHFHAIVTLPDASLDGPEPLPAAVRARRPRSSGSLVAQFKATTTRRAKQLARLGSPRLWQRNYDDRIIRNTGELDRIRAYIRLNPVRWGSS